MLLKEVKVSLKKDKVWVLVETIHMHRIRYVVEVPKDHPEYALDDVVSERAQEFSQEHLGETIVSHRVISEADALQLCNDENDYAHNWSDEKKVEAFFTRDIDE